MDGQQQVLSDAMLLNYGMQLYGDLPAIPVFADYLGGFTDYFNLFLRLYFHGYEHLRVTGDGNCYYRSFSLEVFGTDEYHPFVRAVTAAYLRANRRVFEKEYNKDLSRYGSYDNYCNWVSVLTHHAHELAIKASCAAFCVKIVRLYSYSHHCIDHLTPHHHFFKKVIYISFIPKHADAMFLPGTKPLPPLSDARKLELMAGGYLTYEDLRRNVDFVG